jgi:predicted Rdx family selenoprotein
MSIYKRKEVIMELKYEKIDEKMKIMHHQILMKIEINEVMIWEKEKNEERSKKMKTLKQKLKKM